ncbi:MAG: AMP-dependent synthetase [Phycisphaeraceae bacterium]|nr:AMP-dependent synthetase [Phycisphaeraceae bacterium]
MNIGVLLTRAARRSGDKAAIVHGDQTWTYDAFDRRANQMANALRDLGVKPGDHVALLMFNGAEMLEAMFAAFKLGAAAVPINFRLHPNEYAYIIDHSESAVVFCSPQFSGPLAEVTDRMSRVRHVISVGEVDGDRLDYEATLATGAPAFDDVDVAPDDVAWLFYTSGTTGRPKGAMLTHRNLLAMTMSFYADMCRDFGWNEIVLHVAPLSHGSGLYALPNIGRAATHVIPSSRSFDARAVLEAIERYGVTNLFAAPTMIKRLVECPAIDECDLSTLKCLDYGGAPILLEDLNTAMRKLGPCLVQLYGQGESPMTITYLSHEDHVLEGTEAQLRRLTSAGTARTDVEVAIFDADDRPLPVGETGEIVTRSDLVMKGYWRDPEATATTLRHGWLHTGDVGYFDEQGYLFLMDRSKDMIISGGENIYPREIEEVLIQHPAVREVAVIGVPDPEWGEAIMAVVAADGEVGADALIALCRAQIASYKKPKYIEFVDELPKNNYGKIVKRDLRERYGKKA